MEPRLTNCIGQVDFEKIIKKSNDILSEANFSTIPMLKINFKLFE